MLKKSEVLVSYAVKYHGDWYKISKALKDQEPVEEVVIEESYVTIFDDDYPDCFLQLRFPPWVIFYKGDLSLLQKPSVTIVGSRNVEPYGVYTTRLCADVLSKKYVLVSGLARGVDGLVHEQALKNGTKTIGVIGCGLMYPYPKVNLKTKEEMMRNHLVISEYPGFTKPNAWHFPWRNRLLACIGDKIVVTQATVKSGTMCTVKEALELSKDVYVVPWPINDKSGEGCNLLLQQGAFMVSSEQCLKGI